MYNSQYYTCEQIDERLLQGYLDDYNTQTGQSLTKAQFLTKLGSLFSKEGVIDNTATQIGYYECDTAAGTAAKAITVANYALFAGGSMKVKFANKNTANNATLNINSQGAKALYYQGERASATNSWDANEVVEIYYDGTSYYANNVKGGSGSGVYDVSKEHPTAGPNSDGKFTLEYILNPSNVNELIPVNKRYPGMTIQFVSTSDNKYVQYRLMLSTFTAAQFANAANWQGVDDEPIAGSESLISSMAAANIAFHLGTDKVVVPLRNGSPGNSSNTNAVCPVFIIKKISRYARILTDRPVDSGCVYHYGLITYSIAKGEVITNEQYKVRDLLITPNSWSNNIIFNDNEIGFAFSLYQYNVTNSAYVPLRISDFQSYNVYVEFVDSVERFVESDKTMHDDVLNYKYINLDLRNGTPQNPSNINAVACPFIVDARKFKKGRIITNRPASESHVYDYIIATNIVYEGNPITPANHIRQYEQVNNNEFILENGEIGVSIGITEVTDDNSHTYNPIREADFNGYYVGLLLYNDSALFSVFNNWENSFKELIPETHIVSSNYFRNGSPGNTANQNSVCCGIIIDVSEFNAFEIFTDRPVTNGCVYKYCYNFYDVVGDASSKHEDDGHKKIDKSTPTESQKFIYSFPYNGLAFGIYEVDKSTSAYHPLRVDDFAGYKFGYRVYKGKDLSELVGFTKFLNVYDVENGLIQLNRKSGNYASSTDLLNQCLTFLQITDVHGSVQFIERLKLFREEYKKYFTDIINTGDIVQTTIYNGSPINQVSDIGKHILTVIGNHDSEHADNDYSITAQTCYETFIEDYINYWNVVSPGVNKCYYYKDYSDFGIRLIVLDCMHYDNEQDTWFADVLESARQNNLSVVAASHCPPAVGVDKINCNFTRIDNFNLEPAVIERLSEDAFQKVDDFIDNDGKFICWLMGHTHNNIIGKVRGYDSQLVFIMENSNHNDDYYLDYYNDSNRIRNSKTEDAINIISFDSISKLVKVFRIGNEYDRYMRSHKSIVVNYETGDILSEQ